MRIVVKSMEDWMAARAKEAKTAKPLKCSICQTVVTPETYAQHIQQVHSPAPAAAPAPAPAQSGAWQQFQPQNGQQFGGQLQPMAGPIRASDLAGGKYLKGTDVPNGVAEVRFKINQFVRDPQGRSRLTASISETYGKVLFGFNATNIKAVMALGVEDMQALVGRVVVCMIGMAPNPQQNGAPTKALFVSRIESAQVQQPSAAIPF